MMAGRTQLSAAGLGRTQLIAAGLALAACGSLSGESAESKAQSKGKAEGVMSTANPRPPSATGPGHSGAVLSPSIDREAFCQKVLPAADVGKFFPEVTLRGRAKPLAPAQSVECLYRSVETTRDRGVVRPLVDIKLRIDCRNLEDDVSRLRRVVKTALGGDRSTYRDVDYGRGGGYIRGTVKLGKSGGSSYHQLNFLHDEGVPCTFTVLLAYVQEDKTDDLARLLMARITAANRPK